MNRCALCHHPGEGVERLCPEHRTQWETSPEHARWGIYRQDWNRSMVALRDWAARVEAENKNGQAA